MYSNKILQLVLLLTVVLVFFYMLHYLTFSDHSHILHDETMNLTDSVPINMAFLLSSVV